MDIDEINDTTELLTRLSPGRLKLLMRPVISGAELTYQSGTVELTAAEMRYAMLGIEALEQQSNGRAFWSTRKVRADLSEKARQAFLAED